MEQKTIWMPFLIIGISLTSTFLKSCDDIVEPVKTVQYVYKNQTENDLVMDVFSQTSILIHSYNIKPNEQIISNTTKVEEPGLFYYDSDTNKIGDSIVIKFSSEKCVFWTKNNGDRIFSVSEYDNYSTELLKEKEYQLEFSITQSDFDQAVDCN